MVVTALWRTFPAGMMTLITWQKKLEMIVLVVMQMETTMSNPQCFKKES